MNNTNLEKTAESRPVSGTTVKVVYKKSVSSAVLTTVTWAASVLAVAILVFLVGFILVQGVGNLTPGLFSLEYNSDNVSLIPALINTLEMTGLSLLIAVPIGVCAAIFLVEYANNSGKVVGIIRITAETLSGIPSIVYGLFGMLFFTTALHWGLSVLSGAFTMAIMILPLIMRTSEEALKSVPDSYREASFGLGAGKLRTISKSCFRPPCRAFFPASFWLRDVLWAKQRR